MQVDASFQILFSRTPPGGTLSALTAWMNYNDHLSVRTTWPRLTSPKPQLDYSFRCFSGFLVMVVVLQLVAKPTVDASHLEG
jgi:hypothetical protein